MILRVKTAMQENEKTIQLSEFPFVLLDRCSATLLKKEKKPSPMAAKYFLKLHNFIKI